MSRRRKHHTERLHRLREEQLARVPNPALTKVVDRNIATISRLREEAEGRKSLQERGADWITRFSGSMTFVYLHAAWFAVWIVVNLGLAGLPTFDPYPFGLLTLIVSLEAIFLSTFVLLSQNRQAALADHRADLDLQINLLAEYEITRILSLVDAIADKLEIDACHDPELAELEKDVEPDELLRKINGKQPQKIRKREAEKK
ncbi:MAG: DUF1003 domain-containing protein [Planctomycetia bacterium]|nr:DUF1003 domain-containing protein [Planctomycetia bacterium]